ncbi:MATE family efflux transporter [Marinilabilia salmonicolor]|jgi:putative MATE family efflux protein|uniref:Multidrug export protein MepA n=1 Tax=Marinilabilia salmonicolor TaxID=989 RepID=A0A368VA22_9BACT|nr:MATE family efflux transporter [Marinilabilia salmonicolor]RCW37563.1 putative MATE family efflux protein [Marinilabilia salmonicolor]
MNDKNLFELENNPVGALMWRYFWPAFIGVMANSLYNIIDRIFIGQFVGPEALSGVTAVFPVMVIMMAFGMLIGVGASVRLSLNLGRKNLERARKVVGNTVLLIIIVSLLVTSIGFAIKDPMLRLFGATDSTVQYANDYLNYILWGVVLHEFGFSMNSLIRAEGNARLAMISMLISAGINIPLDAFFIIYLDMGVQGAALATIISMACLSLWVLIHFKSKRCVVQLKKKYIGIDLTILGSIVTVGLAPFAMQIANSAVQALLNLSLIKYGSDLAVGAMGIIMSVVVLITMSIVALNMAGQPIIGYNYGARNFSRVRQTLKTSIIFATAIAVVSWVLIQSFPGAVISLFVSDSPEIMRYGVEGLRYFLIALPIVGYQIVVGNYFQSVGKAGKAIFVTLLRQVLVLIPLLIVLPRSLGLLGVWIAAPLADTVSGVVSALFLVYEWRRLKRQESLIHDAG